MHRIGLLHLFVLMLVVSALWGVYYRFMCNNKILASKIDALELQLYTSQGSSTTFWIPAEHDLVTYDRVLELKKRLEGERMRNLVFSKAMQAELLVDSVGLALVILVSYCLFLCRRPRAEALARS